MSQKLDLVMRRRVGSRGGWQPILQRLAFGLYATDQHGWKLASCLLSALGKDQSSAHEMAPRSGGARDSRSWHDLHAAHESAGKNRHVYGCAV